MKKGIMKSNGWVGFSWMDEYTTWEPADFGGIMVTTKKSLETREKLCMGALIIVEILIAFWNKWIEG